MAARKKTTPKPAAAPRRRRRPAKKKNEGWKPALAALAGGVGTAGAGYLLVRAGVSPMTTAVGLTAAGSVAAATTQGRAQSVALGAAGLGTGQLALALIAAQASKSDNKDLVAASSKRKGKRRQDEFSDGIESAFDRAREQMAMDDEADAFSDDFEQEDAA